MPILKEVSSSRTPEDHLRLALEAPDKTLRSKHAREGLHVAAGLESVEPDTKVMLIRQLYLAELESHHYQRAAELAAQMADIGPFKDIAHHDGSRALQALGNLEGSIAQQRLAARTAPVERRSFHYWCLATLLQLAGSYEAALGALEKGERWAHVDRPLLRAHRAWIELETGDVVEELQDIIVGLESSSAARGYGRFILGMLYHQVGDEKRAAVHLRAFLRRNAALDPVKAITLSEELHRARSILAQLQSD